MHCTSIYPTPYGKARLGALRELSRAFPDAPVGLSDHSIGNYTSFAAVALGACILEKHFTSDPAWPGPDVPISIDPAGLRDLITGTNAVYEASGGEKNVLPEEKPTIDFAYASVVAYTDIRKGDKFTRSNLWVRRPGNGDFGAGDYNSLIGLEAAENIPAGRRLCRKDVIFP
jgi:N-acetylneuraminate synthase